MESIELMGTPTMAFSGFIITIEGDPGTSTGVIDRSTAVSGTFDANGLLVVTVPDLENPSYTLILSSASPAVGTDVDADDDGVLDDPSVFGTVFDAIGIRDDANATTLLYGDQLGGVDFPFTGDEPGIVFRDPNSGNVLFAVNDPSDNEVIGQDGTVYTFDEFGSDPTMPTFGTPNPANDALPISLTSLSVVEMGKTAMVKWSTATESGNSHFVVERSQGGGTFTEIGRVTGAGDSYGAINYDFTDVAPANGDNYYRLRQVDFTGATTVFGPVMVSFEGEGITAFPNPVGDRLFVSGAAATSRTTILDFNGRVLSTNLTSGNGIATDKLAPGTYLLRVESAEGTETLRFVKQ